MWRIDAGRPAGTELKIPAAMPTQMSSTAQDLARGKPSEIDFLNGYVVRKGAELGIRTPTNHALQVMAKLAERSKRCLGGGPKSRVGAKTRGKPHRRDDAGISGAAMPPSAHSMEQVDKSRGNQILQAQRREASRSPRPAESVCRNFGQSRTSVEARRFLLPPPSMPSNLNASLTWSLVSP